MESIEWICKYWLAVTAGNTVVFVDVVVFIVVVFIVVVFIVVIFIVEQ